MQFVQSFLLVASSLILLSIAFYAFTHRKTPGAFAFFIILITTLIWTFGSFLEISASTLESKLLWRNLQQIGVFGITISSLYFAVAYTGYSKGMKYVVAATVPQAFSVFLIFTNDLHHWMRSGYALESSSAFGQSLVIHSTTLGSVLVAYNFSLPLIAIVILLNYARKLSPGFRKQVYVIISCFLYTFVVAFLKTAVLEPLNIFIQISVLNMPATLIIALSIFRRRTFSLSPIARDKVFNVINQGIVVLDAGGTIIDTNALAFSTLRDYFNIQHPHGSRLTEINAQYPDINTLIRRMREGHTEICAANTTEEIFLSINYYPLYQHQSKFIGSVLIINNITVQKLFERNLKDKAEKDYLTKLLNKFGFQKALKQYLSDGDLQNYSVLMIDIDNFKQINDTFGHAAGDSILRDFTRIINCIIRSEDIAGRLGGDEFVIVIPNIAKEMALQIADRIRTTVEAAQIMLNNQNTSYTISIGIADNSEPTLSFDDILKHADTALYQAKNNSRNCSVVYTEDSE